MHTDGDEVHVSETEASGGSKEGVVRWVLIFGTLLAILLLSAIWIFGAATQGDVEEEATVSGRIEAEENDTSTDSILGAGEADDAASDIGTDEANAQGPDTPLDTINN